MLETTALGAASLLIAALENVVFGCEATRGDETSHLERQKWSSRTRPGHVNPSIASRGPYEREQILTPAQRPLCYPLGEHRINTDSTGPGIR